MKPASMTAGRPGEGMRPLPPLTERHASIDDQAKDGYSLAALEDLLSTCDTQPDWRDRTDRAHAYYDMGKQLTPEKEAKIRREWGIEPRQTNLIHGVINGVLGQEAKSRTEVRVEADDDEFAEVADVFNRAMHEAQREANVDMAISNGYAGQVKGGIGWVEVSRSADPLDYPYRVRDIHRGEIWWDMRRGIDLALDDSRWQVRRRWEDLDEAVALMPQFREILESAVNGWDIVQLPEDESNMLYRAWTNERRTRIQRDEWLDSRRRRIKFFEVWYRVPAEAVVMHLSPTRRVVFDPANPLHREAVSRGRVKVTKAPTRQIRMALFAGPHRLIDVGTNRRRFPYVPFFGFRDDEDGSPYGLIEGMMGPQDEFNERRQMVNWMLQARQLFVDNDALDQKFNTIVDVARGIMRPDFVAVLDANRRNGANAIKYGNDLSMQKEQFEVMQDAKQLIQDVPKVYSSMLGNAPTGVTSGIANSLLIEQGIIAMGELNDNYRFSRKMVHEALLELIVEDHLEEEMKVVLGSGNQRRTVVLNTWDPETGAPLNRVKDAPVKVGLSDVPTSPAFRQQEQQQLATIIQALATNPQAMALLAPAYIEGSSLSNRKALADDLRRASGLPTSGDRDAQQRAEVQAAQMAQRQAQLTDAAAVADVQKKQADARLTNAKATQAETAAGISVAQQELAERQQGVAEIQQEHQMRQDMQPTEDDLINESIQEAMPA